MLGNFRLTALTPMIVMQNAVLIAALMLYIRLLVCQ